MRELYELKKQLVEELESIGKKPLNTADLAMIDTLAHSVKNLCKVIEACEDEEESSRRSYRSGYGRSYDRSYEDGGSMRSRRSMYGGEPGREWSGGHDEKTIRKLEELRESADESTRRVIDKALRDLR